MRGGVVGDNWSLAWRVYDAQYWGVPQRRKRIYLVADFGSRRAPEILFERESLRGDPAESGAAGEGTADDAEGSAGGSGGVRCLTNMCYCIKGDFIDRDTRQNGAGWSADGSYTLDATDRHAVCVQNTGRGWWNESDTGATLRTPSGGGGDGAVNANLVVYDARGNGDGEIVPNLTGDHENRVTDYAAVCVENSGHKHDVADTIDASYWKGPGARNGNEREVIVVGADVAGTLCAGSYPGKLAHQDVCQNLYPVPKSDKPPRRYIVRRLTPLECCRLQGFPDWWEDGADGSDSARYKMWGNGIALPCAADVLGRITKEMMKDDQR